MDISKTIAEMKKEPGFTENVGMVMVHNGVVRGWSRKGHETVKSVNVTPNVEKMREICAELEKRPGIWKIKAEANSGELKPGDDLLFLVVAGDIRENVKATFAELLDKIKAEAVFKKEELE